jgi:hypothetical protein
MHAHAFAWRMAIMSACGNPIDKATRLLPQYRSMIAFGTITASMRALDCAAVGLWLHARVQGCPSHALL